MNTLNHNNNNKGLILLIGNVLKFDRRMVNGQDGNMQETREKIPNLQGCSRYSYSLLRGVSEDSSIHLGSHGWAALTLGALTCDR